MVDKELIKAKIAHAQKSLVRLNEKRNVSLEEFQSNLDVQDIVIHNLQLAIQACIDIASHIISDEGWEIPTSLVGLFEILCKHKVIDVELSEMMKSMVGFRNIIVHEYEEIDLAKVHDIPKTHLGDFEKFFKAVSAFAKL